MVAKRIPQLDSLSSSGAASGDQLVIFDTDANATKRILRSDLYAASAGASLVGYTQGGSGASARNVQDKLREVPSIDDYANVAAAISAAITESKTIAVYENLTVNIPSDATTFQVAIDRLTPIGATVKITLRVESGHAIASQLLLTDKDAHQFEITSVDSEVTIVRSALTSPVDTNYYPAFAASGAGAVLPNIAALFSMDSSGTGTSRNGIYVTNGARGFVAPGAGVKNAGGRGLHVANGAVVVARSTNFSGAAEAAVRCAAANCEVREANLSGSGKGLMVASTAQVDANNADISGCTIGIEVFNGVVRAEESNLNNCGTGIAAYDNAKVSARAALINSATTEGVAARRGAQIDVRGAEIQNAGTAAITASSCGSVSAFGVDASGAGSTAVLAINGFVNVADATLTNAGTYGVHAQEGSLVDANSSDTTGAGTAGFFNQHGAFINATNATGTLGRTQNVPSRHGFIFSAVTAPWDFGSLTITPSTDNTHDLGTTSAMVRRTHTREVRLAAGGGVRMLAAGGAPEGSITAPVGSVYLRTDGGAGTTLYIKETGTGNTGWVAK